MIKNFITGGVIFLFLFGGIGCKHQNIPLDKDQFTALLLDMHRVDGTLSVNRKFGDRHDIQSDAYYNDLFKKYGITQADFDSCMYYYSAQSKLFSQMYDVIIDSLNKQVTRVEKQLNELKANDSINYFPILDTLYLDSVRTVVVDSIVPGLYKFSTTLQFDSLATVRLRRISSFFLSEDGKDTLNVRDIVVTPDTNKRTYNWVQYADSVYSHLVICYMEVIPWNKRSRVYKNGKWVEPDKKEKVYDLKDFRGRAWDNQLFRPYVSKSEEKIWQQRLPRRDRKQER